MRWCTSAAVVAMAIALLAGCSGGGQRNATLTTPYPGEITTTAHSRNRAAATAFGRSLLGRVVLPPGSVELHGSPSKDLAQPISIPFWTNLAMLASWWRLPLSQAAALAFLKAHQLSGTTPGAYSGPGGKDSPPGQFFTDEVASPPPAIQMADVIFDVLGVGSRVSELRATAQVVWRPDRPSSDYLPKDCTEVLVAKLRAPVGQPAQGDQVVGTVSVTNATTIARWVARINQDPSYSPPIRVTSLGHPSTSYRLTFVCSAHTPHVAVYASTGYSDIGFVANGATLSLDDDDGRVATEAAQAFAGQ